MTLDIRNHVDTYDNSFDSGKPLSLSEADLEKISLDIDDAARNIHTLWRLLQPNFKRLETDTVIALKALNDRLKECIEAIQQSIDEADTNRIISNIFDYNEIVSIWNYSINDLDVSDSFSTTFDIAQISEANIKEIDNALSEIRNILFPDSTTNAWARRYFNITTLSEGHKYALIVPNVIETLYDDIVTLFDRETYYDAYESMIAISEMNGRDLSNIYNLLFETDFLTDGADSIFGTWTPSTADMLTQAAASLVSLGTAAGAASKAAKTLKLSRSAERILDILQVGATTSITADTTKTVALYGATASLAGGMLSYLPLPNLTQ